MAHLCWTIFFGTNYYYYFHLTICPFHCAKFRKIVTADAELWGCTTFRHKMVHLTQTKNFLENYWYHSHLPTSPFIVHHLKKNSSRGSRVVGIHNIWDQNEIFFRKLVNEPCFFHSCLYTWQKSKSDINLLVKYWQLKNTEISLAGSLFWL